MTTKRKKRQRRRKKLGKLSRAIEFELLAEIDELTAKWLTRQKRKNPENFERRNRSVFCHLRRKPVKCFTSKVYNPQILHFKDGMALVGIGELGNDLELTDKGFERIGPDWIISGLDLIQKTNLLNSLQ